MNTNLTEGLSAFLQEIDTLAKIDTSQPKLPSHKHLKKRIAELASHRELFSPDDLMKIAQNLSAYEERIIARYSNLPEEERNKKTQKINHLFDECIGILGEIVKTKETDGKFAPPHLLNLVILMSQNGKDNGSMSSNFSVVLKDQTTSLVSKNILSGWITHKPDWLESRRGEFENYQIFWQKENGFILLVSPNDKDLSLESLGFNSENFESIDFEDLQAKLKNQQPIDFPCKLNDLESCLSRSDKVQRNVLLMGHGNKGSIANLSRSDYQQFLTILEQENTVCLSIKSCYSGEKNKIYIQKLKDPSTKIRFPIAIFGLGGTTTRVKLHSYQEYFNSLNDFFLSPAPKTRHNLKPILNRYQEQVPANAKIIVCFPSNSPDKIGFRAVQSNISELSLIEIRKAMKSPGHNMDIPRDSRQIVLYLKDNPVALQLKSSQPPQLTSLIAGPAFHYVDSISTPSSLKQFAANTLSAHKAGGAVDLPGRIVELETSKAYLIREIKATDGTFKQVMIVAMHPNRHSSETKIFYATENQKGETTYHQDTYDLTLSPRGQQPASSKEKFWKSEIITPLEFAAQWVLIQKNLNPSQNSIREAALEQHQEGKWEETPAESFWEGTSPPTLVLLQSLLQKGEVEQSVLEKASNLMTGRELSYLLELGNKQNPSLQKQIEASVKSHLETLTEQEKLEFHLHRFKQGDSTFIESLIELNLNEKALLVLIEEACKQKNVIVLDKLLTKVPLKNLPDSIIEQIFEFNLISIKDFSEANPQAALNRLKNVIQQEDEKELLKLLEEINLKTIPSEIFEQLVAFPWKDHIPLQLIQEAAFRLSENGQINDDEGIQLQFILKSLQQGENLLCTQFLEKNSSRLNQEDIGSLKQFLNASQRFYHTLNPFSDVYEELTSKWESQTESLKKNARAFYLQANKDSVSIDHYQKFLNSFNPAICALLSLAIERKDNQQIALIAGYALPQYLPESLAGTG